MYLVSSMLRPTPSINSVDEYTALVQPLMDAGHKEHMADLQGDGKLIYRALNHDAIEKTIEIVSLWASKADYDAHSAIKLEMWTRMEAAGIAVLSKKQEEI